MVVHAYHPSTQKAKTGCNFKLSLGYRTSTRQAWAIVWDPHLQELRYNPNFNVSFRINVMLYLHTRKCISINWIVTVEERIKGFY